MSRDGSLVSKKQAQWEKERAEKQEPWFPFGRPGCGSPNKKTSSYSLNNSPNQTFSDFIDSRHEENLQLSQQIVEETQCSVVQTHTNNNEEHLAPCQTSSNPLIPPGLCYVNPLLPYQPHFPMASSHPPAAPYPTPYMYGVLPQGTIPVPIQIAPEQWREAMCPASLLQNMQYAYPMHTSFHVETEKENSRVRDTVPECPSSFNSSENEQRQTKRAENEIQMAASKKEPTPRSSKQNQLHLEQERLKFLRSEEEERRLAEEKEEELRRNIEKRHTAVLQALEKAQKDAEILKKAKLYKHIIDGSDEKAKLEETLLGVDLEKGEEALKQIHQFEKQKQLDWESQKARRRSEPVKKKDLNDNHLPNKATRSRSSSFDAENLNNTFSVYREKENIESQPTDSYRPEVEESAFRRIQSLRLPNRVASSFSSGASDQSSSITNPLFSPISTRTRRMRCTHDGPLATTNCENVITVRKDENLQSPIPKIMVENEHQSPINAAGELFIKMRSRSTVTSPTWSTSSTPSTPLSSIFVKKLAEKGCTNHGEDRLSPEIRRRDEVNLSRQSSMASLKGSLCNLRGSVSNLTSPADSPNLGKYRSMNPAYRSFNVKKASDRQKETLERLTKLREQLRAKENFYERPLNRNGSNHSVIRP